jgi:predicted transcriptional regulator
MTNSQAVIARLERGTYMPDMENKSHYQAVFNTLLERTQEQIKALEAFSQIDWRE